MPSICIVDVDCGLDRAFLAAIAEAASVFATRDLGRAAPYGWGTPATVRLARDAADVQPGEWFCGLWRQPDAPGALGYHDRDTHGNPILKVFPLLAPLDQLPSIVTHEIGETLSDPEADGAIVCPDGAVRANETCDPVEQDSYPITVSSGAKILVSNWVTPAYFSPPADLTGVPLDHMGLVSAPYEIRPGGYQLVFDPLSQTWGQRTNGRLSAYRQALLAAGHGRVSRRLRY